MEWKVSIFCNWLWFSAKKEWLFFICFFNKNKRFVTLLVYADDIVVIGDSLLEIEKVKYFLKNKVSY